MMLEMELPRKKRRRGDQKSIMDAVMEDMEMVGVTAEEGKSEMEADDLLC